MLRKTIFLVGSGLVVGVLMFGRDVGSYVRTGAGLIKTSVRDSVPVQFEFERARDMVRSLEPEIRKNMHLIAKEEVEINRLKNQAQRISVTVDEDRNHMAKLASDLQAGGTRFVYAGKKFSADQVKADLANRLKRAQTNELTYENMNKIIAARESRLDSAKQKLEQTLAMKRQALVEIENLEARQKMVEVASTAKELSTAFDESRVSRTRELLDELSTRIQVAERMVDVSDDYAGEIRLDETESTEDVLSQVTAFLGSDTLSNLRLVNHTSEIDGE